MKAVNIDGSYLTYKGKPLVRKGNDLFYGDLSDDYYLSMMIMSQKTVKVGETSVEVPDTILVQVCSTPFPVRNHTHAILFRNY